MWREWNLPPVPSWGVRLFACEGECGTSGGENWLSTNKKQGEGVAFSPVDVASAPRQENQSVFQVFGTLGKKKQERKRCNFPDKQHFVQLRRASDSMTRPTGWTEFNLALQTLKVALTQAVATIKVLTYKIQMPRVIKPPQRVPCHATSAPQQSTQCKLIPTIPEWKFYQHFFFLSPPSSDISKSAFAFASIVSWISATLLPSRRCVFSCSGCVVCVAC